MNDDEWVDDSLETPCTDPDCWCHAPRTLTRDPRTGMFAVTASDVKSLFINGNPAIDADWQPLSNPDDGRPWTARPDTTASFSFTLTRPVTDADTEWMAVLFGRVPVNAATRELAAKWSTTRTRQPFPWQPTIDVEADPEHDRTIVPVFAPLRPATDPAKFFGIPVIVDPSMPVDTIRFRRTNR